MTDDTAKGILGIADDAEFYLSRTFPTIGKTLQGYGNNGMITDLKAMARLWLLLPEIRTFANGVYPVPDKLIAKLSDESLQGKI